MTDDSHRKPPNPGNWTRRSSSSERPEKSADDVDFGAFVSDASRRWSSRTGESTRSGPTRDSSGRAPDESGGGDELPPPVDPGEKQFSGGRNALIGALVGILIIATSFVIWNTTGDDPESSPTAEATIQPTSPPITPATIPVPPATLEIVPTSTAETTVVTTPTVNVEDSEIARHCADACLVRVASSEDAVELLRRHGDRSSFNTDAWIWAIASRESIAVLDLDGLTPTLIRDSSDTLNLYVATLPQGQTDFSALGGFGDLVDSVDAVGIVVVGSIPANVKETAAAGIDIRKFAPASNSNTSDGDQELPVLEESGIYGLSEEVNSDGILKTITDLQGTSSTDGTGIGTRQYLQPGNVIAAEYLFRKLESYGLTVHYEDFISPEGTLASNIVAEIPGRDTSAVYGVMAHFDSIAETFSVAPGADDNATGVAAALEIARILSEYDLEHPVHIIFINAEETGIVGSRYFAANALKSKVPYEGVFNLDSIGSARQGELIWLNSDTTSEWMMSLMIRVNDAYGLGQDIQARINPQIVADDNRLREQGFESILVARELFGSSPYHHTSNDTLANVSIPNTESATQLVLLTIASLLIP